jgi:hypothetical protein
MSATPLKRKRIAVFPGSRWHTESRLLASLAELYPIDFVPESESGFERMDGALFFSEEGTQAEQAFERGVSSFLFDGASPRVALSANATVSFSSHPRLHAAFRNAQIPLGSASTAAKLNPADPEITLASYDSLNLWLFRSSGKAELHRTAIEPSHLRDDQLLWAYLRPDNWVALFPLMHFLRRVTAKADWSPAPTQACFMFDDPNLHSVRYGHLDFLQVARECLAHKYHVAVATIPLDAWYAAPNVVELFHKYTGLLSLLIHGNDHVANELARERSPDEALRVLAQALKRMDRFERRTRLSVGRVIAPPHGGCSESMLAQMLRLPFEGVCTSVGSLAHSYQGSFPLHFGLSPVSFLAGEFPMLRRWDLHYGLVPLRLAAFLGQPIIPYGHHGDCAGGVGQLAEVADTVNGWGPATWTDPVSILRGHYRTKRDGELLHVQMWSRRVHVTVPEGVSHVMVHAPVRGDSSEACEVTAARSAVDAQVCAPGVPIRVAPSTVLELSISRRLSVDPAGVSRPRYRVWPTIRRTLAIGRDRLTPILRSVRASTAARLSGEVSGREKALGLRPAGLLRTTGDGDRRRAEEPQN